MSAGVIAAHYAQPAYRDQVLADLPLAHYRLGETTGTTMVDSSGNGRNGTYVAAAVTLGAGGLLTGDSDKALDCKGTGNPATVAAAAWQNPASLTLEALIQADTLAAGSAYSILDRDNGGASRVFQFRISAQKLELLAWNAGGTLYGIAGSSVLSPGTRYHVAATYDGAVGQVYVNGVLDGSGAVSGALANKTLALALGYNGPGTVGFQRFDGRIDEAAIYGSALSAGRIAAHYAAA